MAYFSALAYDFYRRSLQQLVCMRMFLLAAGHGPKLKIVEATAAILLHQFLSCLVSKNVSLVVSALQFIVCVYISVFCLIRSLVDPTLRAFIECGPLQFLVS